MIAEVTGSMAGMILDVAACIAVWMDMGETDRLPDTTDMNDKAVVQHRHRNACEYATRAVVTTFGEIRYPS